MWRLKIGSARPLAAKNLVLLAVGSLAFLMRLGVVLNGGGFSGNIAYDGSVYYASADAFTFGRLPYRDFVLLHPPGIMLALSPFAVIGRLTTDHRGFVLAILATMALGGVNAALVVRIGQRLGLGTVPSVLGGVFYAVWGSSVMAEYVIRLEPVGNTFLLIGLLLCLPLDGVASRRPVLRAALGGAALACAVTVKIWWALPLLVILGWFVSSRSRRRFAKPVTLGAVVTLVALNAPFFAIAPHQMFSMIVTDQFGRARSGTSLSRATQILGLVGSGRYLSTTELHALVAVATVGLAAVLARSCRIPAARPVALIAVAQLVVLLAAPSWYYYYADFLTPAVALTIAAATVRSPVTESREIRLRRPALIAAGIACAVGLLAAATTRFVTVGPVRVTTAFPSQRLAALLRQDRCVMADSPMGSILIDTLSRDLSRGCPNWVDVTGRSFGVDAVRGPNGIEYPRSESPLWQRDILRYLTSGNAALVVREPLTGMNPETISMLGRSGVLAHGHGYIVYATPQSAAPTTRESNELPVPDLDAGPR